MKKIISLCLLSMACVMCFAQSYNNEWIDYSKIYYKFKLAKDGLFRINQPTLSSMGLGNVNAQEFQLWRNGEQVAIYTSKATGVFDVNDYIEFWGRVNDGKMDKVLYPNPAHQLSDKLNLLTDSSTYFLTINTNISQNFRYKNENNNVAANTLPAQPYFIHSLRINYKDQVNRGYNLSTSGESIYSSSYEEGEILSSAEINTASKLTIPLNNLFIANAAPVTAQVNAGLCGNAAKSRLVKMNINGTNIYSSTFNNFYSTVATSNNISLSTFSGVNDAATIEIQTSDSYDRIVASFFELQYPRLFNFGNQTNFSFTLPASSVGNFLQITNFNAGSSVPFLYDVTNRKYYIANTAVANTLQFALTPTTTVTNYILVSEDVASMNIINNLDQKRFVDYLQTANQADYLIVSGKTLTQTGNAVEQYRAYRSQNNIFNAKVFDADELADQFAFGVRKHPLSIRNFVRFATAKFSIKPKFIFMIGKAYTYDQVRTIETKSKGYQDSADRQDVVPTFGWPASDALLVSDGFLVAPLIPFGRLAAINNTEVMDYLDKVKQYEQQVSNVTPTIESQAWKKQLMHVAGAEGGLADQLTNSLNSYADIARDTFFGAAPAITLTKKTGSAVDITTNDVAKYFENGLAHITYFGHSAANTLAFNLNDPEDYNNYGKYPNFLAMGCSAGNIFDYDPQRFVKPTSLSERYVLIKDRGSISFIASTHFGFVGQLDIYGRGFYNSFSRNDYGKSIGINMLSAASYYKSVFNITSYNASDLISRIHIEQFILHGDPAIKIYNFSKPDFVVEDPQVKVSPTFISILNNSFNVKANILNIGKATGDSVRLYVRRTYPNGSSVDLINKNIPSIRYNDTSVNLNIPINAATDKGNNSITITIDYDNKYDELSETNNSITKQFYIFEDEVKPVYPPNYSINNKPDVKLSASTASVFVSTRQYIMELDTTSLFNSSFKVQKIVSSTGGLIEFDPGITFKDSTVYYWRVAIVPAGTANYLWANSSFVHLQNATTLGYNQSHFYQHTQSDLTNFVADSVKKTFEFEAKDNSLTVYNSVFPFNERNGVAVNDELSVKIAGSCWRDHNIIFNVFDKNYLNPMYNTNQGGAGKYGSQAIPADCVGPVTYDFTFAIKDTMGRNAAQRFMDDIIPDGSYVVVRNTLLMYRDANTGVLFWGDPALVDAWKPDAALNGNGKSLYNSLKAAGFTNLDSFNRIRSFEFIYQKNNGSFIPISKFSVDSSDIIGLRVPFKIRTGAATIISPKFGPVSKWYSMIWNGKRNDLYDIVSLKLLGVKANDVVDTLATYTELDINNDISNIDPITYPYLKIYMQLRDTVNTTAYQLNYWRLLGDILPEGGIMPVSVTFKDTLQKGQLQDVAIAFKNVSVMPYTDSIPVKLSVTDNSNVVKNIIVPKLKKLAYREVDTVKTTINTANFVGNNTFYININPNNNPREQTLTNNIAFKNFFVIDDKINPTLDVTFDGIHILNNDIVSSKPSIRIALKDEAKYLLLNDTSVFTVKLRYPDLSVKRFRFDNDTLRFIPASNDGKNTAVAEFNPRLMNDGEYELYVIAKDKSDNAAGPDQYRVLFTVNNKPMISNMLNYPNPFTTSTAFVFTLTGSEIPQNIRIQILTITGKIVKEITKHELGNIHIGRNITDYKWDGTDMFGQPLGNGVYLYRVITSLDGKALDKYTPKDNSGNDFNTDKYFKQGYGKMYLMR